MNILAFILYVDETHVTYNGRNMHPIYMSLANLHLSFRYVLYTLTWKLYNTQIYRQKLSGKRLLGFLPSVSVLTKYRSSSKVTLFKRLVLRKALAFVTQKITDACSSDARGLTITVNGSRNASALSLFILILTLPYVYIALFVHPRLAFIITDEKDLAGCVTGMFSGPSCRRPCSMCLLDFTEESLTQVGEVRTLEFMRRVSHVHY